MNRSLDKICCTLLVVLICLAMLAVPLHAADNVESNGGLVVVIGCDNAAAPGAATSLAKSGNTLVHAIVSSPIELARFNQAIAKAKVKGCVTAEELPLASLPYRDAMVNNLVVMDIAKAKAAGFQMKEAIRCVVPKGMIILSRDEGILNLEEVVVPACDKMDTWTHRYYDASGIPASKDRMFDLPVGFKWNAGLPMNFDNPVQSANRYSSTRALVVDDNRCFTFSTVVYENLGDGWRSKYGADQYLTCRDAFNGRLLWRKRIGDTYYGGLYIENTAPLVSAGKRLYLAGENEKMLAICTRTGETVRELPTAHIPGVIATADGVVVAATWSGGKTLGSITRYDRRRMDWEIGQGTLEAYDDATGKLLWKNDLLGTSLLIDDGLVLIVNRTANDPLEKLHNRRGKDGKEQHPPQKVIALDLAKGTILWQTETTEFQVTNQAISLEAATDGTVAVALQGRSKVVHLSAKSGKPLTPEDAKKMGAKFFRFRNHICTPVFRTSDITLNNRGGALTKAGKSMNFGGARAACLTGTVPAYGAGYIAQNWCRCSPGQIPGLIALGPIGTLPTPDEMEKPTEPIVYRKDDKKTEDARPVSSWTSARGNAERSSSSARDIPSEIKVVWSKSIVDPTQEGTVSRDWRAFLNSRLTAAVISGTIAIVGDIDQNEIIAMDVHDGSVKWRFPTSGRFDTAPTLYKGLCLVGDYTGYVYAIKIQTGELVYKLRIAPFEKRMLSYGKVESVWPVIGGVMVTDDKAYASAGRTQGSDGGLVVRAFTPETGKPLWAKALPQSGNGLIEKKPKRNDILVRHGSHLTIMGHWLKLDTGVITPKPEGPAPNRTVVMGLEGLISWNWTRLGHRKFMHVGYGEFKGDTVSWNDQYVVTSSKGSAGVIAPLTASGKKLAIPGVANYQATSLVLCRNGLIQGGAILDQETEHGFIRAIRLEDGKVVWEKKFDSKLAFNGLAVDFSGIIASFDDGTVASLK